LQWPSFNGALASIAVTEGVADVNPLKVPEQYYCSCFHSLLNHPLLLLLLLLQCCGRISTVSTTATRTWLSCNLPSHPLVFLLCCSGPLSTAHWPALLSLKVWQT
jgi:hypothetical protein